MERAAWCVQVGLVVAALAGLAGGGPLSRGEARASGLRVEYARIARAASPGELRLELSPELLRGGEVSVRFDRAWLSGVKIEGIEPEPERSETQDEGTEFVFRARGAGPARVRFDLQYRSAGLRRGTVGVEEGPEVTFSQWIHP